MYRAISFFATVTVLIVSCASPSIVTTYKNADYQSGNIHSVLVAAVVAGKDTLARNQVENYFSSQLNKIGYHAQPLSTAFGPGGLAHLAQEETLMKLCNYGIDAVLTIALVDGSKEKFGNTSGVVDHVATYYLDRIWNYEKIQANLSEPKNDHPRFWECILFDLYALQPVGAVQTQLFDVSNAGTINPELAVKVIAKMRKEKLLRRLKAP